MRTLRNIRADYALGPDDPGYDAASSRLAYDAGGMLAEIGRLTAERDELAAAAERVRALITEGRRVGHPVRVVDLVRALDGA